MPNPKLALLPLLLAALLACGDSPTASPPSVQPPVTTPEPHADPRVNWLRANAIEVRTTDPADTDFADLQPLREVLDGVRVVMLGEQSHGDGTTFQAKIRLIKFLHQEMGFDVLAWESGIYDVNEAWEAIEAGEDALSAARRGVFEIWMNSAQVRPIFPYVQHAHASGRPLEMAGFDAQFSSLSSRATFLSDLEAALRASSSRLVEDPDWPRFEALMQSYLEGVRGGRPATDLDLVLETLERARGEFLHPRVAGWEDAAFWAQVMESVREEVDRGWAPRAHFENLSHRDRQMARNLLWLVRERYPDRKMIVWAASSHVSRNLPSLTQASGMDVAPGYVVMGDHVHRELGDEAYALGFLAGDGQWGRWYETPRILPPPDTGTLDHLFVETGFLNAFVDFRSIGEDGAWLREPMVSRAFNYREYRADWTHLMDGILFTRVMTPSTGGI